MRHKLFLYLSTMLMLMLAACSGSDPVDTTGSVSGTVYDANNSDQPLKGVSISVVGHETKITKTTDAQGQYSFANLEMGEYTIQASMENYGTQTENINIAVGQQRVIDFHLRKATSQLRVTTRQLDFGITNTNIGLDIYNDGQATMQWEVAEDVSWLECSPRSGSVRAGDKATITVSVTRSDLSYGDYSNTFVISTHDGGSETIKVNMSVSGEGGGLPQVSMLGVDGATDVAATFSGNLVSIGTSRVTRHGFVWDVKEAPSLDKGSSFQNLGAASEPRQFKYSPSNLEPNTTYYVRAFATNEEGTVYSRQEERFTTKGEFKRPVVETGAVSQLTSNSATLAANITDLGDEVGVTDYGHVWSVTQTEPTLDNTSAGTEQSHNGSMTQTTSFTSKLSGLRPGMKYYYRAYARNAQGTGYGEVKQFTTSVGNVELTTYSVSDIIHNEATCGGHITNLQGNTVIERGVCWGRDANPNMGHSHKAADGDGTDWTVRMTGLTEKTTYHVRSYVRSLQGETYFGQDVQFTTTHEIRLPQATATTVSGVGVTTATLRASVTNDGDGTVSDCGFCYATHPNPSVADTKVSCGSSTQAFSKVVSGLKEDTKYYVCAYVTNERGTGYGEQADFTTLKVTPPTVTAVTVSGVTFRSAVFAASVTSLGNGSIKRTGFCYSTSHNPTLSNHLINCGTDTSLRGKTSSLTASTTYYVRAFAENEKGVAYSEEQTFTTNAQPEGTNIGVNDYGNDEKW